MVSFRSWGRQFAKDVTAWVNVFFHGASNCFYPKIDGYTLNIQMIFYLRGPVLDNVTIHVAWRFVYVNTPYRKYYTYISLLLCNFLLMALHLLLFEASPRLTHKGCHWLLLLNYLRHSPRQKGPYCVLELLRIQIPVQRSPHLPPIHYGAFHSIHGPNPETLSNPHTAYSSLHRGTGAGDHLLQPGNKSHSQNMRHTPVRGFTLIFTGICVNMKSSFVSSISNLWSSWSLSVWRQARHLYTLKSRIILAKQENW